MGDFNKLELSTETLRELSGDEMARVAGGAQPDTVICLTGDYTRWCPTFNGCIHIDSVGCTR